MSQQTSSFRNMDSKVVHPWEGERPFTPAEFEERGRYLSQYRFTEETVKRRKELEKKIHKLKEEFDKEEMLIRRDYTLAHSYKLWSNGIQHTRERFIPAYCFPKFLQLPIEVQLRVWALAMEPTDRHIHSIVDMRSERAYDYRAQRRIYTQKGSSRVELDNEVTVWGPYRASPLIRACRNSRMVAMKTFSLLSCKDSQGDFMTRDREFVNTMHDRFYMGGEPWHKFKVLVDLVIKLNTTRPLPALVQRDLNGLCNIRHLIVDFPIFAEAPKRVWAEFPKLKELIISFYPVDYIRNRELPDEDRPAFEPKFLRLSGPTRYKKRAEWIESEAIAALRAVKNDQVPGWKLPRIEAVTRLTEDAELDFELMATIPFNCPLPTLDDPPIDPVSYDESMQEYNEDIETEWFEEAEHWIKRTVDEPLIKRLKHRFHPSERKPIRKLRSGFVGEGLGEGSHAYITDSEKDVEREEWLSSDSDDWDDDLAW